MEEQPKIVVYDITEQILAEPADAKGLFHAIEAFQGNGQSTPSQVMAVSFLTGGEMKHELRVMLGIAFPSSDIFPSPEDDS